MKTTIVGALVWSVVSLAEAPSGYRVLQPIVYGTISVFPVVGGEVANADGLLTLDEGVGSGDVTFAEHDPNAVDLAIGGTPDFLPEPNFPKYVSHRTAVSVKGDRPLLLLAGEAIHISGHTYAAAEDCIVPPHSVLAELKVREAEQDRWSRDIVSVPQPGAAGIERRLRQLNAVGVVIAVGGQLQRAETFASVALFGRYLPKLVASLDNGSMPLRVRPAHLRLPSVADALNYLDDRAALSESTKAEPHVYRLTRIMGRDFDAAVLTSLLAGSMQYEVHMLKVSRAFPA